MALCDWGVCVCFALGHCGVRAFLFVELRGDRDCDIIYPIKTREVCIAVRR